MGEKVGIFLRDFFGEANQVAGSLGGDIAVNPALLFIVIFSFLAYSNMHFDNSGIILAYILLGPTDIHTVCKSAL
jgi:hypothetical protein